MHVPGRWAVEGLHEWLVLGSQFGFTPVLPLPRLSQMAVSAARAFCQSLGVRVNLASSPLSYLSGGGAEGCTFWIRICIPSIQSLSWIHPEPKSYLNKINSIAFTLKIPGGMECVPGTRGDPSDAPVSHITRELHWLQLYRELRMKAKFKSSVLVPERPKQRGRCRLLVLQEWCSQRGSM